MDNLLGIDLAQHKKAVLAGSLHGKALVDIIRSAVTHPAATVTAENLVFVHRFLVKCAG